MKKHLFSLLFCLMAISVLAENSVDERLIGRWELCTPEGKPMGGTQVRQKIYTKNSYVVLEVNKEQNTTMVDFIGTLTAINEGQIVEVPIYTNSGIPNMLFQSFSFLYRIEDNYLYLGGIDNSYNEIWIKISD